MRYELYVDSLFLVNFVMNLYILMLVNRSTLGTATPGRLLMGAALGSGGYLLLFLIGGPVVFKLLLGAGGALGMLLITFPVRGLRNFLKILEKMLFYSFCFGGALLFLTRRLKAAGGMLTGVFGILGLGGVLFLFLGRCFRRREGGECICRATLRCGEEEMTVCALIDSGNSLTEPVSGRPVSVVEQEILCSLLGKERQGFRAIPYHSIGKKRGILAGYLLPELSLEIDGMRKVFRDIYVAASPERISNADDAGNDSVKMIINPCLLQEKKRGKSEKGQNVRMYDSENSNTGKDAV
ncbi:MAG: sigma-E processing peptidase SpoIIGA [bacterium]|nr:sigma-E processing peptidase SpoIIGA [bacterium]